MRRLFRFERPTVAPRKIVSSWVIARRSLEVIGRNWRPFLGITLWYMALYIFLVRSLSSAADLSQFKSALAGHATNGINPVITSVSIYTVLLSTSGVKTSQVAGAYETFLVIIISLALIWSLRQVMAGEIIRVRDAFYKGMYPLIPVLLVVLIMLVQCLPLIIGSIVYGTVVANGIAITLIEKLVWIIFFLACTSLTFYWLSSSVFAIYIVTLPDMTPMKAIRSASKLVRFRRWPVLRKLLFLPIAMIVVSAVLVVPVVLTATALAPLLFLLLAMAAIVVFHAYMYTLYRELLV